MKINKIIMFILMFMFSISIVSATTNDAIIYYSDDDTDLTGTTIADISGVTVYDGTLVNGVTTGTTGIINEAFTFDGLNDYVDTNYVTTSSLVDFTISTWIKINPSTSTNDFVWGNYNGGAVINGLQLGNSGADISFQNRDSNSVLITSAAVAISKNVWHHVVVTRDSTSNENVMYIDNVVVANETDVRTGHFGAGNDMLIGARNDLIGSFNFWGDIDETAIYDRSLSVAEVDELWNSGNGFNPYASAPSTPTITIDDISLVNNSYHNTNLPIQLNLSVTDTNSNVNSSYILKKEFINPTYNNENISQASTSPFIVDGLLTRNQFCIENGYDSAYTYNAISDSNPAIYYNGASWGLTTINTKIYDSITCQKETQFGTNTLQSNDTIFANDNYPLKNGLNLLGIAWELESSNKYCRENYNLNVVSYETEFTGSAVDVTYYQFNTTWTNATGTTIISNVKCGLDDDNYNISFQAENNETQTTSSLYTFIIDTTNPSTEVITNETEFNTFQINMSNIFNYSDINLDTCNIILTELSNVTINDTDTFACDTLYNFSTAGLHNLRINVTDLAGNYNDTTQINITINPYVLVFFNDTVNSTIIKNYTSIIYHPDGRIIEGVIDANGGTILSPVNNGILDLGIHTVQFSKLGYGTINVTVLLNETNAGRNETFNVTRSKIILTIFNRATGDVLTGLTKVTLVSSIGFNATTTTGYLNITDINFLSETYQLVASHTGYNTEQVFFTYNNQEELEVEVFMLELNDTNFGTITMRATAGSGLFISGASCSLLEWKPTASAYESVAQGITDVDGTYKFAIELNTKIYKALCSYNGISKTDLLGNAGLITVTGEIQPIYIITDELILTSNLLNVDYSFTNTTENSTHDRLTFTWTDNDGLVSEGCINLYNNNKFGKQLISSTCASGSSNEIQIVANVNNSFNLLAQAVLVDTNSNDIGLETILFPGNATFEGYIQKYHLDLIIPILFFFLGVGLGLYLDPQNIYISLIAVFILSWIGFALVPSTLSFSIVTFISVVDIIMIWGTYKAR